MRNTADVIVQLLRDQPTVRLKYGVATALNTVRVGGATTAVVLPALINVNAGQYVAILEDGADRLILGPVIPVP